MHRQFIIAAICFVAAACSPAAPTAGLNQDFMLAPGATTKIDGTTTTLRFVRVDGDSRCPTDATCIQAGDATVRIEALSSGADARPYELHTADRKPTVHEGLTIALVDLAPHPLSSRVIQPDEYRATFHITR